MSPERSDLLEVVNTEMGRDVPVGQAYYDEPLARARSIATACWWPAGDNAAFRRYCAGATAARVFAARSLRYWSAKKRPGRSA